MTLGEGELNRIACVEGGCSSGKVTGLIVYATFAFIWISQVVGNVILTTLAGGIFGGTSQMLVQLYPTSCWSMHGLSVVWQVAGTWDNES